MFTEYIKCYFRVSLWSYLSKNFLHYIFFSDILGKSLLFNCPNIGMLNVKNEFRSLFLDIYINASLV